MMWLFSVDFSLSQYEIELRDGVRQDLEANIQETFPSMYNQYLSHN